MNKKDLIIMSHLRRNSRATITEIAKKTGVPISTIYEKIKRSGPDIIQKNTCLIDFNKLGFYTRAKIVIQARLSHKKELLEYLIKHQNINSIYKINNGVDFLTEGVFRNMKDMEEFIELLQSRFKVKKCETYFIIEDLKREAFLSDPDALDLVV